MLIRFDQKELEVALRAHIINQGINLTGKAVSIEFTATRKEGNGVVADVSIEAIEPAVPDTLLRALPAAAVQRAADVPAVAHAVQKPEAEQAPFAVEAKEEAPVEAPAEATGEAKTTSLFGA